MKLQLHRLVSLLLLVVLAVLLAACDLPNEVTSTTLPTGEPPATEPTGTETPIPTPEASETPAATPSVTPSASPGEATPTPIVGTPGPTPEPSTVNRFANPEMNGGDHDVIGGRLPWGWESFGCDAAFLGHYCPSERIGTGNPFPPAPEAQMGLQEFAVSANWEDPVRQVSPPTSIKFFCFDRTCRGGVYQTIETAPGEKCVAGIDAMSWSDNGITGDAHRSWLDTQDLVDNSQWRILVLQGGGGAADAFTPEMDAQRAEAPVFMNTYDHFETISIAFVAESWQTTIYFENLRLWPFQSNDNYLDNAFAYCGANLQDPPPPADPPAVPDEPHYEPPINDPLITEFRGKFKADNSQYIRSDHCTGTRCTQIGGLGAGQTTKVNGYWTNPDSGDIWLCVDELNAGWVQNPQFPSINIWSCGEWTAYFLRGTYYGALTEGGW